MNNNNGSGLSHPTAYHVQRSQRKYEGDLLDQTPQTPQNSFVNMDNPLMQMNHFSQGALFQQLQQGMKRDSQHSPQFDVGSDMELGAGGADQILSPTSNSPLDFDDTTDMPLAGRALKSPFNPHMADPFGESPSNTSILSMGDHHDFTYDADLLQGSPAQPSMPIDVKMRRFPFVSQAHAATSFGAAGSSLDDHHFASSAPATTSNFLHGGAEYSVSPSISTRVFHAGEVIPESYEDDFGTQANLQAVMEKQRRRRESHNAVERRRRDNINDKIQELGQLLPSTLLDSSVGTASKHNKGMILRKSVNHIKTLQSEVRGYQNRIQELERQLAQYRTGQGDGLLSQSLKREQAGILLAHLKRRYTYGHTFINIKTH
ncbi:hypothetical protein BZG36_02898, partial [Bifiguratus adelaidae]